MLTRDLGWFQVVVILAFERLVEDSAAHCGALSLCVGDLEA